MMKKFKLFPIMFPVAMLLLCFASASAQNEPPPDAPKQQFDQPQPNQERPNLLRELGLSREQMQQLRRMNADRKPLMDEAARRLREANRNLDQAIYADNVSEEEVQARLKEFQLAQAEVAKLRFMNELNVRRILTPEQLIKFRELRQRFIQMRQDFQNPRRNPANNQPFRRLNRQQQSPGGNRPIQPVNRTRPRPNI